MDYEKMRMEIAGEKGTKQMIPKLDVSEKYQTELESRLQQVKKSDIVSVVYYDRGEYLRTGGVVSDIDKAAGILKIVNTIIPFDNVFDIWDENGAY